VLEIDNAGLQWSGLDQEIPLKKAGALPNPGNDPKFGLTLWGRLNLGLSHAENKKTDYADDQ
jgi:hypothetical protein